MTTSFVGVAPTALLGYKSYYRVTFDITGHISFEAPETKLNFIYDNLGSTGVIDSLSPNPVVSGDTVMVIDCWTPFAAADNVTVAEAVRRMEVVAGSNGYTAVRSIAKLSGIGEVTAGDAARQDATATVAAQNAADSPLAALGAFLGNVGDFATLGVIAFCAYVILTVSAGFRLPGFGSRR